MSSDSLPPVVVLWVHHGSLGIARTLGRLGIAVHGVHPRLDGAAFRSRYWVGRHRWDFSGTPTRATADFLLELGSRLGSEAVLIPTSDDTAELVAEHAEGLRARFRFQENSLELVRALSNKRTLYALAHQHSIPTPKTAFPRSADDVHRYASSTEFPVLLKASDGLRLQARTGKKMVIVRNPGELVGRYTELEDPADPNLMIQEYIPGGDDTIWMFNGYFDQESQCVMGITGKKLRQFPVHTGATSLGICLFNQTVYDLTVRFAQAIGYRGILDIGWRYDARDDQYKLLDPNPRIGSSFRLFVSREGHDVARYLYWDLTGQRLPPSRAREGSKWMVEDQDLESCLDYRREGTLSWPEWIKSYRGVQEAAWFARDDLRPFLAVARSLIRRAGRQVWRRSVGRMFAAPAPAERSA